jgi:hypothetical protein
VRVLAVAGCCSGVGKTTLACRLLEALRGWGALKVSPLEPGSLPAVRPFEILTDATALERPGSDTALYLRASAGRVAWLRAARENLGAGLTRAVHAFDGLPGLVVEGNAPAREIDPDGRIVLARVGQPEIKASARGLLGRARWVVVNRGPQAQDADELRLLDVLATEFGVREVWRVDAARAAEPGTARFLEAVRAWARC